jgi:hypothetical protein
MRAVWLLAAVGCGGNKSTEAAPAKMEIKDGLCVTKGAATLGARVTEPTVRAVAIGSTGEAATLSFTFHGHSEQVRALASGQARRQLGLKLRAANGCNLVYVMWRLDPKPMLDVSVKLNPGMRSHGECGANGYTKVKAKEAADVPELVAGGKHSLRAELSGLELTAWIDDKVAWRGTLPDAARDLTGPAGFRSDNVAFDLVAFDAPKGAGTTAPATCTSDHTD